MCKGIFKNTVFTKGKEIKMHCTNCGQEIANNAAICTHCGVAVGQEKKFCANCGQAVNANQAICLSCGCALTQMNNVQNAGQKKIHASGKSVSTAVILTCLIVGLGQIYLGQVLKGVAILLASIVIGTLTFGAGSIAIWIIAMIDAYKIGKKLEAGQSVDEWEFF